MNEQRLSLHDLFYNSGKTLATAESCTGGGLSSFIIATSGASDYFKGGIVSYSNDVKINVLGVSPEIIKLYTPVSEDVAIQMAKGALNLLKTDYAVSVTGIAGPTGGTKDIPVGTIWICCCDKNRVITLKLSEDKGRKKNIENCIEEAIQLLINFANTKKT